MQYHLCSLGKKMGFDPAFFFLELESGSDSLAYVNWMMIQKPWLAGVLKSRSPSFPNHHHFISLLILAISTIYRAH
jgi:hypothetical protein